MRSRIDFIADRIDLNLEESGTQITVAWKEWPANAAVDPVTASKAGTPTARSQVIKAFLHFIHPTGSIIRQFSEIETGDCIADISPDIDLAFNGAASREDLRFILPSGTNGQPQEWASKPMSQHLAQIWDTMQAGRKLFQTILLRKAT